MLGTISLRVSPVRCLDVSVSVLGQLRFRTHGWRMAVMDRVLRVYTGYHGQLHSVVGEFPLGCRTKTKTEFLYLNAITP